MNFKIVRLRDIFFIRIYNGGSFFIRSNSNVNEHIFIIRR